MNAVAPCPDSAHFPHDELFMTWHITALLFCCWYSKLCQYCAFLLIQGWLLSSLHIWYSHGHPPLQQQKQEKKADPASPRASCAWVAVEVLPWWSNGTNGHEKSYWSHLPGLLDVLFYGPPQYSWFGVSVSNLSSSVPKEPDPAPNSSSASSTLGSLPVNKDQALHGPGLIFAQRHRAQEIQNFIHLIFYI